MFANAGINTESTLEDLKPDAWQKVIDVNLMSVYLSDRYALIYYGDHTSYRRRLYLSLRTI